MKKKRCLAWTLMVALLLSGCQRSVQPKQEPIEEEVVEADQKVRFLAVGDNLIHGLIYASGAQPDGTYQFDSMYARTADTIAAADIAYINQETICGGTELGLQSYPTFNSPYEILDAVANAGFDWLSTSSNHSMDVGEQGIRNQLAHIETLGLTQTGTHGDESDAQTYRVMNKNGLRIGVLSYTYGLNGFVLPQGKEYLVDLIDEEKIQSDMEAIQAISDVQIVSMHWGEEYQFVPNEEQQQLAQLLSDLGADVIIGTHPHVLQPADILTGEAGNETLVWYSLGNFVSAQDVNDRMLGGMAQWTLVYHPQDASVSFEEVSFTPTVMYFDGTGSDVQIYPLSEYSDELGATHYIQGQDMSKQYFIDRAEEIMNDSVELIY